MNRRGWIGSIVLLVVIAAIALGLVSWKKASMRKADAAAANHPEPMETVSAALARQREHRRSTTSIGTVLALRSITLRNELAGTVREVKLIPGEIVEQGQLLVALDVSVEQADLKVQEAQAKLAETLLARLEKMSKDKVASDTEVDRARTERDVALANIARAKAIIERKTIRAPFKARVGLADVHPGQYLEEGTTLTTLQGVDDALHVDFSVPQRVAGGLKVGENVEVSAGDLPPIVARIVAIDARVDSTTRNAMVRARIEKTAESPSPSPGASVRVRVPMGEARMAVFIPASALRRGPAGDHVFIIAPDREGHPRARLRVVQGGAMLGDEVAIHGGLVAGEQVAASGSFKLREGVLVAISADATARAGDGEEKSP